MVLFLVHVLTLNGHRFSRLSIVLQITVQDIFITYFDNMPKITVVSFMYFRRYIKSRGHCCPFYRSGSSVVNDYEQILCELILSI